MIDFILKYLPKTKDILGIHLKSELASMWFTKILLITLNPSSHVICTVHHDTLVGTYPATSESK